MSLFTFPLEILFEVTKHLNVSDLIELLCTNKTMSHMIKACVVPCQTTLRNRYFYSMSRDNPHFIKIISFNNHTAFGKICRTGCKGTLKDMSQWRYRPGKMIGKRNIKLCLQKTIFNATRKPGKETYFLYTKGVSIQDIEQWRYDVNKKKHGKNYADYIRSLNQSNI